jgi:hypothetical protein
MSPTTEDVLDKQIRDISRQIIALAGENGERVRQLLQERDLATAAKESTRPSSTRFARIIKPIKAVLAFLDEKGLAAPDDEIIDELLKGGFGGGGEEQRNTIFWSLRIHLNGTAKHKNIIREKNGLIGRGEWDDSRFDL